MNRFVVGTGRCGSTLFSRMLAESPQVASLFEFFGGLDPGRRFEAEPLSGKDFAALISSEQPVVTAFLSRGYKEAEILYPFDSRLARYKREDPLPWVLVGTLPRLSKDPDSLFDEVMEFASRLPKQRLALHYQQLFDWLTKRVNRELWIERSGCSIESIGSLNEFFPNSRFLHLHRDGPEAALSMREHAAFRLAVFLIYQLAANPGGALDLAEMDLNQIPEGIDPIAEAVRLDQIDLSVPPQPGDPISRILDSRPAVEYFGRYWTDQLIQGFRSLTRINADQYLEVRFEDLVSRPRDVLRLTCDFFELDPDTDGWIDRAAALVRGVPPTRFDKLTEEEQERLARACVVGRQLLGRS